MLEAAKIREQAVLDAERIRREASELVEMQARGSIALESKIAEAVAQQVASIKDELSQVLVQ